MISMKTSLVRTLTALLGGVVIVAISAFYVSSCDKSSGDPKDMETATTGSVELLCDESLYEYLKPTFQAFDTTYTQASVTVQPASARDAMAQLFATKVRGIIIARNYLRDEDSLLKAAKVTHTSVVLAQDALVLFVQPNFPLDTISIEQLATLLTEQSASLKSMFPQLRTEPTLVCPAPSSSEYGNIINLVTKGALPQHLVFRSTADSVVQAVASNPNAIGIGYLSRLAGKANVKDVKLLKIGFTDSTGARVRPKTVHQSYIVMGKYPLVVKIQGLLLEDRRNLPWGFCTYIRNDNKTKEYFLKTGIVPENARFNLIQEED